MNKKTDNNTLPSDEKVVEHEFCKWYNIDSLPKDSDIRFESDEAHTLWAFEVWKASWNKAGKAAPSEAQDRFDKAVKYLNGGTMGWRSRLRKALRMAAGLDKQPKKG